MDRYLIRSKVIFAALASLSVQIAHAQETTSFTYDALGRLAEVSSTGSINNGVNTTYCYDRALNRKSVRVNGVSAATPAAPLRCGNAASGSDFNGDLISDVLWRSSSGDISNWLGTSTGSLTNNDANAFSNVVTSWKIVGTGDFNGDGYDDVLWRNDSGWLSNWLGKASGGFDGNDANALVFVSTDWKVVGTGDFNGDGRSDILWRKNNGDLSNWLAQENGSFVGNDANAFNSVDPTWKVAGTGDFNGDHRDDIVWRNDDGQFSNWLGQSNGGFVGNDPIAGASVSTSWQIIGVGDFNGDGRSDVLWRDNLGTIFNWIGRADGGFTDNSANSSNPVDFSWAVVGANDYNGDGRADILWRNTSGALTNWLGTVSGGFVNNNANALTSAPTNWIVQGPHTF